MSERDAAVPPQDQSDAGSVERATSVTISGLNATED
jgi:hypothetical protein